jgi:hypothetical protein
VKRHLSSQWTRRQWAAMVRELAVPAPFEQNEFRARIERHTHRALELIPTVMGPGAPSGTWLRTEGTDYFYYEEQTSPFHQAHIALSLAACVLLGDASGPAVDLRLVSDVSPELARMMLGDATGNPVTHMEAETFAFLALEHARPASYPPSLARRALQRLRPLQSALLAAVPEATGAGAFGLWPAASARLHRQVIQIRDVALALRPYRDPQVAVAATHAARAAGLAGDELAVMVEASVLSAAIDARRAGHPAQSAAGHICLPPVAGADLRSETACLVKVSRAFAQLRHDGDPARGDHPERRPDGLALRAHTGCGPFSQEICSRLDGGDIAHEG